MNTTRQDAWTKDEDMMLAETVIRFIREGKTQLEAFKEVAKQLSRTSAACGFRWNATIRKQYDDAIQLAKETRKQGKQNNYLNTLKHGNKEKSDPIDMAILLLEKIRHHNSSDQKEMIKKEDEIAYKELKKENRQLKEQLLRYDDAWREMNKLWHWVKDYSYK